MAVTCDLGSEADVESEEENETEEKLQGFAGMGDVICKILEKPIANNADTILCKSKKSRKRKLESRKEYAEQKDKEEKNAENREKNHVIPTRGNAQKEILLKRIATKGVVKLLNAVSAHQKLVSEKMKEERTEAGKCKVAEKVTKSDFMDLLKRNQPGKNKKESKQRENASDNKSTIKKWDVFREDFMLGSSFKDWDKIQSDNEEELQDTKENSSGEDE